MDLTIQNAHPDDVGREEKKARAMKLRIAGYSYRKIGAAMGVNHQTAHNLVIEALNETRQLNAETAEELRRIELSRLDAVLSKLWTVDEDGELSTMDARTADTILRLSERRARLVGLDAPQRWEGSGPGGGPIPIAGDIELRNLTVEQLRQLEAIIVAASSVGTRVALEQIEAPK